MKKGNYIGQATIDVCHDHYDVTFDFLGGLIIGNLSKSASVIYWIYDNFENAVVIDDSYPSNIDWDKHYLSLYGLQGAAFESKRARLLRDICLDRINNYMQFAGMQLSECG